MPDETVFFPEIVEENPFPGEPAVADVQGQTLPAGTFAPTTTPAKTFPVKRTAVELLSTALNTRSRKILEEFELQQSGGLKIGDFKTGISGDLRLTPNGLTARDKAGLTTFVIDGTDGSAIFRGTVQTGAVVAGNMIVGDSAIQIDGVNKRMLFYDDAGIPAILIGNA